MQLTEVFLGNNHAQFEDDDYDGDVAASIKRREARLNDLSRSLWMQIIQANPVPRDGLHVLSKCLDMINLDKEYINPATFLIGIGEVSLDYCLGLCEAILESPDRSLARHFDMLITPIRRSDPAKGLEMLRRALDSDHAVLWTGVASFYYHPSWIDSVLDEDVVIIELLIAHQNLNVSMIAIGALWNLGKARPHEAKQLALSVEFEGNSPLAEELFMRFDMKIGVPIEEFNDAELDKLITRLSRINKLDDPFVNKFLVTASNRRPLSVLRMLLDRVNTLEYDCMRDIQALPNLGFDLRLEGLPQAAEYLDILREVRDRALALNRRNAFLIPQLFREITLNFSTNCLPVLDEWIATREKHKVEAVAFLLRESSPAFVFIHKKFVANLLEIAHDIGDQCLSIVSSHLQSPSITQGKQGVTGEPFPEDIDLRDKATSTAKSYPPGSPQARFYDSLVKLAEDSIRLTRVEFAELARR